MAACFPISRRSIYAAAAVLALAGIAPMPSFAADAQSLYEQAVKMQSAEGKVDLNAIRDVFEKAAASGSALAMQRLGDMYHDGDGGVAKDYAKAMDWYQKEAALDDAHPGTGAMGMIALSEMYEHGSGVQPDAAKSDEWFNKALKSAQIGASKGDNDAMVALAYCLARGHGQNKPDPVNAWQWALKAAKTPNPWACEIMADMYSRGIGVDRNDSEALKMFLAAANMGESQDIINVAICMATGTGVKKDEAAAMTWVRKAVDHGSSQAMGLLGKFYHEGIGVQRSDMTAREWYQKAVELGDEASLGYLGDLLIAPGINPRDALTAQTWYEKGAKAGDLSSMYQLANLLVYDNQVQHDISRAVELLLQASNRGHGDSMAMMGELYARNILPSGSPQEARNSSLDWFKRSAAAGSAIGMRDLGELETIIADGPDRHSMQDDDKPLMAEAFNWLKNAAAAGDIVAMVDIGDAYVNGDGPDVNVSTAVGWYQKAAAAGNVRAIRSLGVIYKDNRLLTNYDQAKTLLEKAISMGDAAAISQLGDMYYRGLIKQDAQGKAIQEDQAKLKAWQLFNQAAQAGDGGGYYGVGQFLQEGQWVTQDLPQAAAYYKQAVDRGNVPAMEALGRMFELGQGVKKNIDTAMQLFTRAKDAGSQSAWSWVFSHTAISGGSLLVTDPAAATKPGAPHIRDMAPAPRMPAAGDPPETEPADGKPATPPREQ